MHAWPAAIPQLHLSSLFISHRTTPRPSLRLFRNRARRCECVVLTEVSLAWLHHLSPGLSSPPPPAAALGMRRLFSLGGGRALFLGPSARGRYGTGSLSACSLYDDGEQLGSNRQLTATVSQPTWCVGVIAPSITQPHPLILLAVTGPRASFRQANQRQPSRLMEGRAGWTAGASSSACSAGGGGTCAWW